MTLFTLLTHILNFSFLISICSTLTTLFYNYGFLLHLTKVLTGRVDRWFDDWVGSKAFLRPMFIFNPSAHNTGDRYKHYFTAEAAIKVSG